jgi:hypothetical protein
VADFDYSAPFWDDKQHVARERLTQMTRLKWMLFYWIAHISWRFCPEEAKGGCEFLLPAKDVGFFYAPKGQQDFYRKSLE